MLFPQSHCGDTIGFGYAIFAGPVFGIRNMAHELECKIAVPSHEMIAETLKRVGAVRVGRVRETNRLLDTADRLLFTRGCGLRVRTIEVLDGSGPGSTLTFKGPMLESSFKRREEVEIALSDCHGATLVGLDAPLQIREGASVAKDRAAESDANGATGMLRLLAAMGYQEWMTFEKLRESWRLNSCKVELDELPLIGRFVEIEGADETAIRASLESLNLNGNDTIRKSYPGLLAARMGTAPPPWVVKF